MKRERPEELIAEPTVTEQQDEQAVQPSHPRDKRKRNIRITAIAVTAVVAAAVIVLNIVVGVLADRFPITMDLTEEELYSLSDTSIDLASQITKDVSLTFFMQESFLKNPGTGQDFLDTVLRQMYTFANEYVTRAAAEVKIHYVDLTENPALAGEYDVEVENYGILFQSGDKTRYFTLDDMVKTEQIPNYNTMSYDYQYYSLVEKTFATGFLSVMSNADLHVTFLTGNGEKTDYIQDMTATYEDNGYTVHTLDFTTAAEINEKCKALIIVGANIDFTDAQIERLTNWLNNGGKMGRHLYVLCDPQATNMTNLYEFLDTYYGIEISDKIIFETDVNSLFDAKFPTFPLAQLQENELMEGFAGNRVLLGNTLAINTKLENDPDNLLIFNTDIVSFDKDTTKLQVTKMDQDGKPVTELVAADEYPIVGIAMACEWDIVDNENVNTYVFVSGGYEVVDSIFFDSVFSNQALLIEPINKMCGNDVKVDIGAFSMQNETLVYTVGTAYTVGLGIFTIGIPALLLIVGLVVFIRRRHL